MIRFLPILVGMACSRSDRPADDPSSPSIEGPFPVEVAGLVAERAPEGLRYQVRRGPLRLPEAWSPPSETWTGAVTLDVPGPQTAVASDERASAGPVPFDGPAWYLPIGEARATVLTSGANRLLGLQVLQAGTIATLLDLDGDGRVDIVEALRITPGQPDPIERLVILSPLGQEHRAALAEGRPGTCSGGDEVTFPESVRIAVTCDPTLRQAVEVLRTGRDAADAIEGLRNPPTAEERARAQQLQRDLEDHGAMVVIGAVLNELITPVLPTHEGLESAHDAVSEVVDIDEAIDSNDYLRRLTYTTDDLLAAATTLIETLGETDATSEVEPLDDEGLVIDPVTGLPYDWSGDAASSVGDPHLTTFDGVRYDFQAAGEFLLSRRPGFEVHARYEPWGNVVSVATAFAVVLGEQITTVRLVDGAAEVAVDGESLEPDERRSGDVGRVLRVGAQRVVVDGPDDRAVIDVRGGIFLDIAVFRRTDDTADATGLLGTANGDPIDDLRLADGTQLDPATFVTERYGAFADSYRLDDSSSRLPYAPGESAATFDRPEFPPDTDPTAGVSSLALQAGALVCRAAGLTEEAAVAACALDWALLDDPGVPAYYASFLSVVERPGPWPLDDDTFVSVPPAAWADEVVRATNAGGPNEAENALGPPVGRGYDVNQSEDVCDHELVVRFTDVIPTDGPGDDLVVFQSPYFDNADLYVSNDGEDWTLVDTQYASSTFDLREAVGPGGTAPYVRLCEPPDWRVDPIGAIRLPGPTVRGIAAIGVRAHAR
ncbi:MAG: VWD domain-containing protein [Myxococcota bacterium]